MKKMFNVLTAVVILFSGITLFSSFTKLPVKQQTSRAPRWEKLGERKVNFLVEKDEIIVGAYEGFFDALQIKVRRSAINMRKMIVHFGNGDTKEIELRDNIRAGGESRVIDLPGNNRIITKVVFWYDTKNFANRKAELELWGRH